MQTCNMFRNKIGKPGAGEGSLLGCTMGLCFLIMSIICLKQNPNFGGVIISLCGLGISSLFWMMGLGMFKDD